MEKYKLINGMAVPAIGLGTWQIQEYGTMKSTLFAALEQGYTMIDTAAAYGNEIVIGKVLKEYPGSREKLFISDKLWNTNRGYKEVQEACKKSLRKLKTEYLDAYLIHWPASPKLHENWEELNSETWRGLETLYREGCVKSIGICNFKVRHLEKLVRNASVMPMINQIEFHPGMFQREILNYCADKQILAEASSPLGNGQILTNEILMELARKHEKSVAQICLKWSVSKGCAVIPKTTKQQRLKENLDIFDFSLDAEEMEQIDTIPYCGGIGIDSDEVVDFE